MASACTQFAVNHFALLTSEPGFVARLALSLTLLYIFLDQCITLPTAIERINGAVEVFLQSMRVGDPSAAHGRFPAARARRSDRNVRQIRTERIPESRAPAEPESQ